MDKGKRTGTLIERFGFSKDGLQSFSLYYVFMALGCLARLDFIQKSCHSQIKKYKLFFSNNISSNTISATQQYEIIFCMLNFN